MLCIEKVSQILVGTRSYPPDAEWKVFNDVLKFNPDSYEHHRRSLVQYVTKLALNPEMMHAIKYPLDVSKDSRESQQVRETNDAEHTPYLHDIS